MMIQKTAVVSEDFTFPQVTSHTSLSSLHLSGGSASSFWYAPSHPSIQPNMPKECHLLDVEREAHRRRSSSFVEGGTRVFPSPRELELPCSECAHSDTASVAEFDMEEERMDMLWEDFQNYDELTQTGLERKEAEFSEGGFLGPPVYYDMRAEGHKLPGFCCVEALKMSKSSRPGVVVMLKVLKKLFLLHNSQCPKRP
ncbi:hypothetical protein ACLOJK_001085 [Asimina triloba]